ncbi:MAG TPA: polyprenyl synthetase family protein [Thermomicrobiales bacterium]|nr:polyprenyl synthetase family protein [Thermomicrobiales bacterium]
MTGQPTHREGNARQAGIDRLLLANLLEREIDTALDALNGTAPLMLTMARYHLGMTDSSGDVVNPETRQTVQGKRIRPFLAMLAAEAVGGQPEAAAPVAAAIELLHNFTLIHDDIQDRSPNRRHRPTVWRVWGNAQAINAGDALFAASQLALLRTPTPADTTLRLSEAFNRMTISIVRGQVHDLEHEGRADVTPGDYLTMIHGKTAAIVRFAAWAGAIVGGASPEVAEKFADTGDAIGMGFQLRDDMLGIWSPVEETGKDEADDIRRRKQSLPILMLRERASDDDIARLNALFSQEEIDPDGIDEVLAMLDHYQVKQDMQKQVEDAHARAMTALQAATVGTNNPAIDELKDLITRLGSRTS